jgi:cytochrome P450
VDGVDLTDLARFEGGFPYELFDVLRREQPVWFHEPTPSTPGGEGFWVLTRYDDVVAAAADHLTFSSESGGERDGGGTLIEDLPRGFAVGVLLNMMDDPRHAAFRRLLHPSVAPRTLALIEHDLEARAARIVDDALAEPECDFLVDVAAELPLQAVAQLLGVPQEDRHKLLGWANVTLDYDDRELGQATERTQQAAGEMHAYGADLLAQKREQPGQDLLSMAVQGRIDGEPLSDLEQAMLFSLLIAAGSETTRNSLALGVLALAGDPVSWEAVRDPSLLDSAVEEMLRWASSTPYNRRTATRDVEVGGKTIRAGDKVTLWWASANRDEDVFADPYAFDVRRWPNPHLAFGRGGHFCLGAALARMEMRVVVRALVERVARIELTGPVEHVRSNKHTGVRHMPVRLEAR